MRTRRRVRRRRRVRGAADGPRALMVERGAQLGPVARCIIRAREGRGTPPAPPLLLPPAASFLLRAEVCRMDTEEDVRDA